MHICLIIETGKLEFVCYFILFESNIDLLNLKFFSLSSRCIVSSTNNI